MVRAFERLMLIVGVVPVAAPTLGGLMLEVMPWQGLFVVLAAFGVIGALAVLLGLRETLPAHLRRRSAGHSYLVLLTDARYVRSAFVLAFTFAALFTYVSVSAFLMRNIFDLDATDHGLMFAAHSVALVAGNQVNGRTAGRWRPQRQLAAALSVALVGAAGLGAVAVTGLGGLAAAVGTVVLTVFGIGMSMPLACSLTMSAHPERAGAASALLGLLQFTVGGVIAPIVGTLGTTTLVPLATSMAVCLLMAMALQTSSPVAARWRHRTEALGGMAPAR